MIRHLAFAIVTIASVCPAFAQPSNKVCDDPRYRDPLSADQGCDYSEFIRMCRGKDCDVSEELVRNPRNLLNLAPISEMRRGVPIK